MPTPDHPQQPGLAAELLRRMAADQHARGIREDSNHLPPDYERMRTLDADNAEALRRIIRECGGWPGHSLVGKEAAEGAWLIAQHSDLDLQLTCLDLLTRAVDQEEATHEQLALLTDRVLMWQGKPQIYGTQYHLSHDGREYQLWDVVDPEHLDRRRASVGLGPHAEYDVIIRQMTANVAPTERTAEP